MVEFLPEAALACDARLAQDSIVFAGPFQSADPRRMATRGAQPSSRPAQPLGRASVDWRNGYLAPPASTPALASAGRVRADSIAFGGKPGSGSSIHTAIQLFRRYCDHSNYRVPLAHAHDSEEFPSDGAAGAGRLYHFACWLAEFHGHYHGATVSGILSTVRAHIAAIRNWSFIRSPILSLYLHRLRQQPRQATVSSSSRASGSLVPAPDRIRQPATVSLVKRVVVDPSIDFGVRTAVLALYSTLCRGSELCARTAFEAPSQRSVLSRDVTWSSNMCAFRIAVPHSKTDTYNTGSAVYISHVPGDPLSPALVLDRYRESEPLTRSALSRFFIKRSSSGVPSCVTLSDVSGALKHHAAACGLDPTRISCHSLRIGGAFQLISGGLSHEAVAVRGRWSLRQFSSMVARYAQTSKQTIDAAAGALSLSMPAARIAIVPSSFSLTLV